MIGKNKEKCSFFNSIFCNPINLNFADVYICDKNYDRFETFSE